MLLEKDIEMFSYNYNLTYMCLNVCFFKNWETDFSGIRESWKAELDRKKWM